MPNERFMRHHYGPSGLVRPTVGPPALPDPTQGALTRQDIIDIGVWFQDENRMNIGRDVLGKALALVGDNLMLRDHIDQYDKLYNALVLSDSNQVMQERDALRLRIKAVDEEHVQMAEHKHLMFTAYMKLEAERDFYKKAWERRGKALALPCLHCGYVQNPITTKEE